MNFSLSIQARAYVAEGGGDTEAMSLCKKTIIRLKIGSLRLLFFSPTGIFDDFDYVRKNTRFSTCKIWLFKYNICNCKILKNTTFSSNTLNLEKYDLKIIFWENVLIEFYEIVTKLLLIASYQVWTKSYGEKCKKLNKICQIEFFVIMISRILFFFLLNQISSVVSNICEKF